MIGEDGRVRVMDFGLARPHGALPTLEALRSSLSGQLGPRALESRMTLTGTMMGTPAYMALEQFDGHADARSDQFSFCVALYEGLYGERPFAADSLTTLLGALASGDVRPAPRGAAVPAWLRAAVLRGLSPDPEKRWPSMDALLAALADDPARRRRRGAGVALSVALVAGSVGGAASYVQGQAHKCMGLEVRLAGVWDDAVKSRTRAAFDATELVYAADSWRGASARLDEYTQRWVTARQEACEAHQRGEQSDKLLDLRMACLDERLQHVQATLRLFEAPDEDTVRKAVEAVAGLPGLERCTDVEALAAEQPPPEDPAARARVVELNAQVIEASALERAGGYDRGLEEATRVATEAAELGYEPLQVRAWLVQGSLQDRKGAYQDAEATLERAYASAMGLTMVTEAAEAARLLVFVVGARQARHEEGRRWAKDAEPLARAAGTPGGVGGLFKNLGNVAYGEGRFDEARAFHERALAISEKALGVDHPDLASSLNNLGNVAQSEGKLDEARAYYERAWAIWEKALGPDHPDLAVTFNNLGNISAMEGKLDEARAYFERARAIFEEALGPDHPDLAASLNNLGRVAYHVGKLDEARAFHERALAIREKALGPDHPALANSLNDLGNLAALEGELDEARAYFERALALWGEALGPDHVILSRPLTGLGETLLAQGNAAEALAPLERARTLRGAPPDDPVDLAETQLALTRALWDAPEGAGRDRDRARELASLAAAAYAAAGEEAASELAEVRAWQSAHTR